MALPVRQQVVYWGLAFAALLALLFLLGDVILPFLLGAAIAYFLDPVADWLQTCGLSRIVATAMITVVAILVFVAMTLLIIPLVVNQTAGLIEMGPSLLTNVQAALTERFPTLGDQDSPIRQSLLSLAENIRSRGGDVLNGLLASFSGFVNILVLVVIVPVVAFYMLIDWDRMVAIVDDMLPRDHAPEIRKIAKEIDRSLAGFIRGQGTVCLILAIYYAGALMLVGLQYGLVVGLIAGALTFIPYVGALVGGALAIGLALFQFWGDWIWVIIVWAIFQSGQLVEGNFLTPKLVGSSVGLHPVWLIFALTAFGTLFGFVGLLVAVPVAAAIGVIVRYAAGRYREGILYHGTQKPDDKAE